MGTTKNKAIIGLQHEKCNYYLMRGNEPLMRGIKMWLGEVYWKDEHPSVGKTLDKHPILILIKLKNKTLITCQFCLNSFT